ncbi:hypothetical protein [Alcaligenes sp.]|uniref:hypothetical protein n=1 Tax=Alcaligenes sp. TaxID=512 RepID=UPI003D0130C3
MAISPVQVDQPGDVSADGCVQALQDENQLLLSQLHIVQAELERLYYQEQAQTVPSTIIHIAPVHNVLVEKQAEILRCEALIKAQGEVHVLQTHYALASQLGEILIQGTHSVGSMLSLPTRLLKVWKQNRHEIPPKALGGKQFGKVLDAFKEGGEEAVEALLARSSVSTAIQASAWTAVARGQMQTHATVAAKFAHRAFSLEPRSFRQKWLAFRLHEAGELVQAEALAALLPSGVSFSESEGRQLARLKDEAKQERLSQARKILGHTDHESRLRQQWRDLAASRDQLAVQGVLQAKQLMVAQQTVNKLQQEKAAMDLSGLETRQALVRAQALVSSLQKEAEEQKSLAKQWFEQCTTLQYGVAELTQARNEQANLASERLVEREALRKELSELAVKQSMHATPKSRKRSHGRKR